MAVIKPVVKKPATTTAKPTVPTPKAVTAKAVANAPTVKSTGTGTAPGSAQSSAPQSFAGGYNAPQTQQPNPALGYTAPVYDLGGNKLADARVVNGVSYTQDPTTGLWNAVKQGYGDVRWDAANKSIYTTGKLQPGVTNAPKLDVGNLTKDPDLQQFADQVQAMLSGYQQQSAGLMEQQQKMTPEEFYKLAEAYFKPQLDASKADLSQQLGELNRQAGITAEARGLSASNLEGVTQSRNMDVYNKGLADIMGAYMSNVANVGSQDYATATSKLNNMSSQLTDRFKGASGAMKDLLDQYLGAWKDKGTLTQGQTQLNQQAQQLQDDKWYKTEVLKDEDAKLRLQQQIAQDDARLRSAQIQASIANAAQKEGLNPVESYNAYLSTLGSAQEAMKTGDFNIALGIINNSPIPETMKAELRNVVDLTRRKIAYTTQTTATTTPGKTTTPPAAVDIKNIGIADYSGR